MASPAAPRRGRAARGPGIRRCSPPRPTPDTKPVRHGGLEVGRQAEAQRALARRRRPVRTAVAHGRGRLRPLAKPPVRKYAKDLGVDLTTVTGRGAGGVITRADVDAAARPVPPSAAVAPAFGTESPRTREQRIPIKGVRKHTAAAMVASAFTAPHVTEFLTVDVTRTMKLRQRLAARPELAGVKVSPLLFVAKARAARRRPAPDGQQLLGRGGPGDRGQGLREPRHRRGHAPRPGRPQHQGRRPAVPGRARRARWAT